MAEIEPPGPAPVTRDKANDYTDHMAAKRPDSALCGICASTTRPGLQPAVPAQRNGRGRDAGIPTAADLQHGSFLAGSIGLAAHPANGLAALFIPTGQDAANVAESHAALTYSQALDNGDFHWSIMLPPPSSPAHMEARRAGHAEFSAWAVRARTRRSNSPRPAPRLFCRARRRSPAR
jgi:hypothetical protein